MTQKTVILWDIDDTLNVHGRVSHWPGTWVETTVTRDEVPHLFDGLPELCQKFDLRVSQELLNAISSLEEEHSNIQNLWLSAWMEESCTIFAHRIGFSCGQAWDCLRVKEDEFTLDPVEGKEWWKVTALREFLEDNPDTRVIWVDDLIDFNEETEAANRLLAKEFEERLTIIGVIPGIGVTPDVFSFLKRVATQKWESGVFIWESGW